MEENTSDQEIPEGWRESAAEPADDTFPPAAATPEQPPAASPLQPPAAVEPPAAPPVPPVVTSQTPQFPPVPQAPTAPTAPQMPVAPQAPFDGQATVPPQDVQDPTTPFGHNIGSTPSPAAGEATVISGASAPTTPPPSTAPPTTPPSFSSPAATPPPHYASPQPATAATPVLTGEYGVAEPVTAPAAPGGSSKLPWVLAVVGAILLLGGGAFFARSAFSAEGGADTPEQAMDEMIAALNAEDFISLGELIEPSERRTIVEPTITELLPELQRIGVFSEDVDASGVQGVDIELTEVTYRVETLDDHPDIVHVFFTGGESFTEFSADEFPFSEQFREVMGTELTDSSDTTSIEDSEVPVVFVERDGRWYVSGWFTIAEGARLAAGAELPAASEAPPALGSDSPEEAVEAMVAEIVELDMAGMIGRMDPDEMAAFYRYSPLFIEEAQLALDDANQFLDDENVSWSITDLDLESSTDGDDGVVSVRGFTVEVLTPDADVIVTYGRDAISVEVDAGDLGRGSFEITPTMISFEGTIDGESGSGEIVIDPDAATISGSVDVAGESGSGEIALDFTGECSAYSVSAGGETMSGCIEDEFSGDEADVIGLYENIFDQWPEEFPGFDMAVRRTDGQWFVSPIGTLFDTYMNAFGYIEDDGFNEWIDNAETFDADSAVQDALDDAFGLGSFTDDGPFEQVDPPVLEDDFLDFDDDVFEDDFEPDPFDDEASFGEFSFIEVAPGATETITGTLDGTFDVIGIPLEAGDTIIVTVEAAPGSPLDPTAALFDPTVNEVAFNDDHPAEFDLGSNFDSAFTYTTVDAGNFELILEPFDGANGSGDYIVMITRS